jgi:peptidoglycan-associated lipoprotein
MKILPIMTLATLALAGGLSGCASTSGSAPVADGGATSGTPESSIETNVVDGTGSGGVPIADPTRTGTMADSGRPDLKRSVYFEFDRFDVRPEYHPLVETHAKWLRANPQARLTIEGNADERGSREYNLALGQRRAESVTRMLRMLGVPPERIEAISFGKERPRAVGRDEAAWAENRRSDFSAR